MKKLLLAVAMLSSFGCHAALQVKSGPIQTVEFTDTGSVEAIVCKTHADAQHYVELAGNADTEGFTTFIRKKFESADCAFMNNNAPIDVLAHAVVFSASGPLWVIKLRQKDVYGKYDYWWSSANYYPLAYPKSGTWEMELIGSQYEHSDADAAQ